MEFIDYTSPYISPSIKSLNRPEIPLKGYEIYPQTLLTNPNSFIREFAKFLLNQYPALSIDRTI